MLPIYVSGCRAWGVAGAQAACACGERELAGEILLEARNNSLVGSCLGGNWGGVSCCQQPNRYVMGAVTLAADADSIKRTN
jgi:hypothetical protein